MKKALVIVICFLMICFSFSCKSIRKIKDTNGPDDYSLSTITDEDIVKGMSSISVGAIQSNKNGNFNLKIGKFSGVNEIYKNDFKNKTITLEITNKVESGNLKIVVIVNNEIVENIPANTTKTITTNVENGKYSIRIAGEVAKFSLSYKMQIQ